MVAVFCVLLMLGLAALAWTSRKESGNCLERMGSFLYKLTGKQSRTLFQSIRVKKDLEHLFPTESPQLLQSRYYVQKWCLVLKIILAGVGICLLMLFMKLINSGDLNLVSRERAGGGDKTLLVEATVGEEKQQITICIEEQQLQKPQQEKMLEDCIEVLERLLAETTEEGELPDSVEGYPFEILWRKQGPGEQIAYFYYGEELYTHTFEIEERPTVLESMEQRLIQEVEKENSRTRYEENVFLPEELDGLPVRWKMVQEDYSTIVFLLVLLAAVGVYFLKDKDLHDDWLKRKMHMRMSYPILLNKFVLYMEAGLTVRGCFLKIATEGQGKGGDLAGSEIYQEMLYSCNELNAGISESLVYERFGKRTGLEEYTRFATMLSQNLKKGNATLKNRLREESEKARTETIHIRKKLGEEAQTKLLLPMVLMMTIVMLLVMVPAFSSF